MIMMSPNRPFVNIAQNMAVGTARLALRVSSPICMTLSKAVNGAKVSHCFSFLSSIGHMETNKLTAEEEDVGQGTQVGGHKVIIPARRNIALEEDIRAVSG